MPVDPSRLRQDGRSFARYPSLAYSTVQDGITTALVQRKVGRNGWAVQELVDALGQSNELAKLEVYAMRLKADAMGEGKTPDAIEAVQLTPEDAALAPEQKAERAMGIMFGDDYMKLKGKIVDDVDQCGGQLVRELKAQKEALNGRVNTLITMLITVSIVLGLMVIVVACANYYLLTVRPKKKQARKDMFQPDEEK